MRTTSRDFPVPAFLTSDPAEARRARYIQFKGAAAELKLNGASYFAQVISVMSTPGHTDLWLVSITLINRPALGKRPRPNIIYG